VVALIGSPDQSDQNRVISHKRTGRRPMKVVPFD
jgi:hypothetical protein